MSLSILPTAAKSIVSGMAAPSATQRENTDFARMLSQREAEQAPARAPEKPQAQKTPEEQREAGKASHAPEKPREKSIEERRLAQAGGKPAGKVGKEADTGIDAAALPGLRTAGKDAAGKAEAAEDGKPVAAADDQDDPVPVDWVAALQLPAQVPGEKEAVSGKRGGADAAEDDAGGATGKARARFGAEALDRAAQDADQARLAAEDAAAQQQGPQGEADPLQNGGDAAAAWQGSLARATEPGSAAASGRGGAAAIDGAAALAGAALAAPASGASAPVAAAAPAPVVHVPTPADSPEFPQALGAQISVLARDGIQQAELHLNPAEMGPISVQIDLQGNQAQVDFGADSAATRQIIENGLPELAAALREAGFTLSGGGVHQQARPRDGGGGEGGQGDGGGARGRGASGIGAAAEEAVPSAAAQRIQARVAAGGVDLYA